MANKQIYELTTRTFDGDSLLPISVENPDSSTATEYPQLAGKTSGNALSDFVANSQQYTTDLDTTAKTITGAINELKSGKANNSDLGITTLSANDLFATGHYIDTFIAFKIGKIVFVQYISSSTMSYGNATDDYLAYFKSNSPYKPVNSVRYCFTTTRDSTIYRGECSSTGLFCRSFPQQGTFGQWAMSFFYEIA